MKPLHRHLPVACVLAGALVAAPALANDFRINNADQGAFASVSKDLVAAYSYKPLTPAEATGLTGIGVGAFGSYLSVNDESAWKSLTGNSLSQLGSGGLIAHKGLPFGFDVGASYAYLPQASGSVIGAEVRYAILEGGIAEPGLAVRGSYTKSSGTGDFDFSTYGIDATVSKGFAFLTPYAGAGYVRGKVKAGGGVALNSEDVNQGRVYVGLRVSALLFEITPEYERVGSNNVYNLRLGFSL